MAFGRGPGPVRLGGVEVRNADRMKKKSAGGNLSLGFTPQNLASGLLVSFAVV